MHASSNRLWHKSPKKQTLKNCIDARCVYEGCFFVSQAAVCTHFSSLECFLSLTCFTLLLCIYSPPFPPFPNACAQICRLYPRDAEADPGADAGRSLTGLYVVHTHLSEQLYPPPFHFRWVHSCIKSMYTCVTRSLSSVDGNVFSKCRSQ